MSFDLKQFAIENLVKGYKDGSFSKVQINIFSMNYMMRGILDNDDIEFIKDELDRMDVLKEQEKAEQEQLEKELLEKDKLEQEELEKELSEVEIQPPLIIEE